MPFQTRSAAQIDAPSVVKDRDRVPHVTEFSGVIVDGYRVVTASDMEFVRRAVSFAKVRGSVGCEEYEYGVAGPDVMPTERPIVRWAVVERERPVQASPVKDHERTPRFGPGTKFRTRHKVPRDCVVRDVHFTRNLAGELVSFCYVATHELMGQTIESKECETTVAMGLVSAVPASTSPSAAVFSAV